MNTDITTQDDPRSSGEIESDIRQTRSRMDSTLDELGNRLSPKSLLNSAFEWWQSHDAGSSGNGAANRALVGLARQARRHPLPTLLIGSGIVCLIADSGEEDGSTPRRDQTGKNPGPPHADSTITPRNAGETASQALPDVKGKVQELGEKLQQAPAELSEKAHEAVDRGKAAFRNFKHEASEGYEKGMRGLDRASDAYPLAIGVGFAALGILAGLMIPRTSREDRWMGEQSDQLRDETREKTKEFFETGKAVGGNVVQIVKEEMENQGVTQETVAAKISEIADRSGEIFDKVKEEVLQSAKDTGMQAPAALRQGADEHSAS